MLYGVMGESKIMAAPGKTAICPICGDILVPKCGKINIWHWAHTSKEVCDSWSESEGQWHRAWKELAPAVNCEVVMGIHRADIVNRNGLVIELQHSPLKPDEIRDREDFYKRMIWLFDVTDCVQNIEWKYNVKGYVTFRWKRPRKHILHANKPRFLDLGDFILDVRKMYEKPCGGWGYPLDPKQFIAKYFLFKT